MGWREDRLAHYNEQIVQLEADIASMEAGNFTLFKQTAGQPQVDITQETIDHDKRILATLKSIVEADEQAQRG